MSKRLRVIGPGRAGGALGLALERAGWEVLEPVRRDDPVEGAAAGVDVVAIATPDSVVADVASRLRPDRSVLVLHCSGALRLDVLASHHRRGSLHPLLPIPSAELGADRLAGAWFAVAGDPEVASIVEDLKGRAFAVDEAHRVEYHAAASIASNHVVGLLGQVQRIAAHAGVPLEAYLDLARAAVESVAELGPVAAITGPIQRGDWATVRRHLEVLDPAERPAYEVMAHQVARLVRRQEGVE